MNMNNDRVPVEGITMDREVDEFGGRCAYWPNGGHWRYFTEKTLTELGIPIPKPPRVGLCGMTEAETRAVAKWTRWANPRSTGASGQRKLIDAAAAQVAEWDAEDAAATPEPETVAVVTEIASYKLPWRAVASSTARSKMPGCWTDGGGHIFDADDVWVADANTAVARWIVDQANATNAPGGGVVKFIEGEPPPSREQVKRALREALIADLDAASPAWAEITLDSPPKEPTREA